MTKKYFIYKITNISNNKIYIGQSIDPNERWKRHINLSKTNPIQYIHRAMNKHGIENFAFEIITSYETKEEVNDAEANYIKEYRTLNNEFGYNIKPGGHVVGVWKQSEETKKIMSEKWHLDHSAESIEKTRLANLGSKKPHSEETKRKIGEANKISLLGKKQSPEMIQKRVDSLAEKYGSKVCNAPGCDRTDGSKVDGVRYCDLHGQRIRKNGTLELQPHIPWNKGIPNSEETRAKLSKALKGRTAPNTIQFTPEQIQIITTDLRPSRIIAEELGVSKTTIKRMRIKLKSKI